MAEEKNRNMNRDQDTNRQGGQGGQSNVGGGSQGRGQTGNISGKGDIDQNKKKNQNW